MQKRKATIVLNLLVEEGGSGKKEKHDIEQGCREHWLERFRVTRELFEAETVHETIKGQA